MTFNPGRDKDGKETSDYTDISEIQSQLSASEIDTGANIESATGPANFMITDPDGNTILIDQHR